MTVVPRFLAQTEFLPFGQVVLGNMNPLGIIHRARVPSFSSHLTKGATGTKFPPDAVRPHYLHVNHARIYPFVYCTLSIRKQGLTGTHRKFHLREMLHAQKWALPAQSHPGHAQMYLNCRHLKYVCLERKASNLSTAQQPTEE